MIVDTSVIIAIVLDEPEAPQFFEQLAIAPSCSMSTGSWIEVAAVLVRKRIAVSKKELNELADRIGMAFVPVTLDQAEIAQAAYRAYGRGSGHRARLNFGDCFAYALAKATGERLLYKGDDFVHTDVASALAGENG